MSPRPATRAEDEQVLAWLRLRAEGWTVRMIAFRYRVGLGKVAGAIARVVEAEPLVFVPEVRS